MPPDPLRLAETVRRIPLEAIFAYYGLIPRREGASLRYKSDRVNIVAGGNALWFDNAASVGGRGPIDLLLHLRYGVAPKQAASRDVAEAIRWLAEFHPTPGVGIPAQPIQAPKPRESFEAQAAKFALRDDARWPMVRSYLVGVRALPTDLVDAAYGRLDLYASFPIRHPARTNVCFVHRDLGGNVRGATTRPADGGDGFLSIGEKQGAWFTLGDVATASRLVITEAPIDALSYAALHRPDRTVILAMSGAHVYEPVLRAAHDRLWPISVGFDNDRAGNAGWERCRENHRILFPDDAPPRRIVPAGKDWNEDLCLGPRHGPARRQTR